MEKKEIVDAIYLEEHYWFVESLCSLWLGGKWLTDVLFLSCFGPSVVLSSTWHILQSPLAFDHTQDFFSGWNETHYILLIFLYLFIFLLVNSNQ